MNFVRFRNLVIWLALMAAAPIAAAQSGDQLIQKYTAFAGSEENATRLVNGLKNGTEIVLASSNGASTGASSVSFFFGPPTGDPGEVRFTSPTGPMGYGNVDIALSLAKAVLEPINVSTPSDIRAALVGGGVTTPHTIVTMGVLELRHQGLGWGEIARQLNVMLPR